MSTRTDNSGGITDYAKDTILSFLQEFFSNERNVGGDYRFSQTPEESKILIADKYTINLEDVEKRPAIVVMRGAQSWANRGIDSFYNWEGRGVAERFTDLIQGAFNCTCLSKQGLEAEHIAHAVFAFFQFFRKWIRKNAQGVHDIRSLTLGEEMMAVTDSDTEISVVPVTVTLMFQWTWSLEQTGPPFANVDVNVKMKNAEAMTRFLSSARLARFSFSPQGGAGP